MEIDGDRLIFDTGKSIYVSYGVIGMSLKSGDICEGFDARLWTEGYQNEESLTPEERYEVCKVMVNVWNKAKAKAHADIKASKV